MTEFVEVIVEATGRIESVPADWLDNPVLGKGLTLHDPATPAPPAPEVAQPPSDVQLTGPVERLPIIPAERDKILEAEAAAAAAPEPEPPTEGSTHDEIDAFAKAKTIDLGDARTKAEKLEAIDNHLKEI